MLARRGVPGHRPTVSPVRSAVVAAVVATLTATGAMYVPPSPEPSDVSSKGSGDAVPARPRLLDVDDVDTVASTIARARPEQAVDPMRSAPVTDGEWPRTVAVSLDAATDTAEAGPVGLRRDADAVAPAQDVDVAVLDRAAADAAGVDGVLLTVSGAEGEDGDGVELAVDYSGFAGVFGADWASRLTLVRLPSCVLTTPDLAECQVRTPVPTSNDLDAETLVADLSPSVDTAASDATGSATSPSVPGTGEPGPVEPSPGPTVATPTPSTTMPPVEPSPSASSGATTSPTPEPSPVPSTTEANEADVTARSRQGQTSARGSLTRTGSVSTSTSAYRAAVMPTASQRAVPAAAAGSQSGVLALMAAAAGPSGNFGATPLSPSATWQVSAQTGDFTWSYPLEAPPAAGGPEPDLALTYSSGSLDGRIAGQNSQSSWVGDGWDLSAGFIERRYVPCAQDMTSAGANNAGHPTGDMCWGGYNATMAFGGHGGDLVRDAATGAWKLKDDDGTRIELLTNSANGDNDGEYWKVTTTDGTQYWFGRGRRSTTDTLAQNSAWLVPVYGNHAGDPCNASTFASSSCLQAWRWNLDYVVDPSGNSMTYVYAKEENKYSRNIGSAVSTYTRGGYLTRVDYGQRAGSETDTPPQRVELAVAERCVPSGSITCDPAQLTAATASSWPDVPFDLICEGTACPYTPSFFTRKRLASVTTKVWAGSAYQAVDTWTLTHTMPDPGDATSATLWLASIQQRALAGSPITLPATTFAGTSMANRVDSTGDAGPPMNRFRLTTLTSDTGSRVSVAYTPQDCATGNVPAAADTNTRRCFPVMWSPEGATAPIQEYFHKYLVTSVAANAGSAVGNVPVEARYTYGGSPAWHYDDNPLVLPAHRTWGEFRGYGTVDVVTGATTTAQLRTRHSFFRGMHGDRLAGGGTRNVAVVGVPDEDHLNGFTATETTFDGATAVSAVERRPWSVVTATAADGTMARIVQTATTEEVDYGSALPADGRRTRSVTTFDPTYGLATMVDDQGDIASTADDRCTRIEYARNAAANIADTVSRSETVGVSCGTTPNRPTDVVADVRNLYDGGAFGATPTRGLVTATQQLSAYTGTPPSPSYLTRSTTAYDALGRPTTVKDALDRVTTTAYTPATGGPLTRTVTTSPDPDGDGDLTPLVSTTDVDPFRGVVTQETDPNGKVTTATHDALGRTTQVWLPGRAKGVKTPDITYAYALDPATGVSSVATSTLTAKETYRTGVTLYDALLRPRQTQTPSSSSAQQTVVTDTFYDSRGLAVETNHAWPTDGLPRTALYVPTQAVPSRTRLVHDGAGRPTVEIFDVLNQERWRTTTTYRGDRTDVDPPTGAVPTTSVVDARGRLVELQQYPAAGPTGPAHVTRYTYDDADRLRTATDPVGNTWSMEYDLLGRQTASNDPDKGRVSTTYDDGDQRTSTTDARGAVLAFAYDGLGRQTAVHEESTSGPVVSSFVYDTLAKGRLTSATQFETGTPYTTAVTAYDDGYRPLGDTVIIPPDEGDVAGTYTTRYSYTADGQLRSMTLPAAGNLKAETITTNYDSANQPEWMGAGAGWGVYVAAAQWSTYGEPLLYDLGNTLSTQVSFGYEDGTRRLKSTRVAREGGDGLDRDVATAYDDAGNPVSIIDRPTVPGAVPDAQCFRYDALRRLSEVWTPASADCTTTPTLAGLGGPAPYWKAYTYDTVGNRTADVSHTPSGDLSRLFIYPEPGADGPHTPTFVETTYPEDAGSSWGKSLFITDESGNLTLLPGDNTQELWWDVQGNLQGVEDYSDGSVDWYHYGAAGQRLVRHQGDATTVYLPGGQEITATDAGVVTAVRYYSFGGTTVAVRTGPKGSDVSSLVTDPQGTAEVAVRNVTNDLTVRRDDPFGNARGTEASWPGDRGYLQKPHDSTGLVQVGARYYTPDLGRFASVDPIMKLTDPQQWNPYAYANSNPVTYSDPTGLEYCGSTACARSSQAVRARTGGTVAGTRRVSSLAKALRNPVLGYTVRNASDLLETASCSVPTMGSVHLCGSLTRARHQRTLATKGPIYAFISSQIELRIMVASLIPVGRPVAAIGGRAAAGAGARAITGPVSSAVSKGAVEAAEVAAATATRPSLRALAAQVREAGIHAAARNQRVIAVGEDGAGGLHAGSSNGFDAGQRAQLEALGITRVPGSGSLHAEEELIRGVTGLKRVGTSKRDPCGPAEHNCAQQLAERGIEVEP